jgi:hypothetical protein
VAKAVIPLVLIATICSMNEAEDPEREEDSLISLPNVVLGSGVAIAAGAALGSYLTSLGVRASEAALRSLTKRD